jgi:ketosteroid isomerase-like protein
LDCQHIALIRLARHSQEIEMRSTSEVLAHHLKCFAARDLDGLMSDYAADALFFTPDGVLRGPEAIRGVFEKLFSEIRETGRVHCIVAYLPAETPDNSYELANDVFVVRNGSVQMQAFTAKPRSKHSADSASV